MRQHNMHLFYVVFGVERYADRVLFRGISPLYSPRNWMCNELLFDEISVFSCMIRWGKFIAKCRGTTLTVFLHSSDSCMSTI
jgi:hypothetical protein